jgi:glycosyltransferase involved in cell wall biosynthesis
MKDLISVIIPIYKVEEYLLKCVESIIHQTYRNLEIILVDDGSPDRCGEMCDEYATKDSRIKVIHKQNGGLSDARNVAIDVAKGEYITFVDSDDYVSVDYISTLYGLIDKYRVQLSVACFTPFYDGEIPEPINNHYEENCYSANDAVEQMFYQEKFDTCAWAKMYHRTLFQSGIRYPKGFLYEDLPTTYRLMFECDKVAFCNQSIYFYRLRKDSIEGSQFSSKKMDSALKIIDAMNEHIDLLIRVKNAFICRMFSFSFHLLLAMPDDYEKKAQLYKLIKENRFEVLTDRRARRKARYAALVSYLGTKCTKSIFSHVNKRK